MRVMYWMAVGVILGGAGWALAATRAEAEPQTGPVELRVDELKTPLGIDDPAPRFSWQLADPARGAEQTAYELEVASQAESLAED